LNIRKIFMNKLLLKVIITGIIVIFCVSIVSLLSNYYLFQELKKIKYPRIQVPHKKISKITMPKVIFNVAGTVEKIEGNRITLKASIPYLDEQGNPAQKTEVRTALITPSTKFTSLIFVSQPNLKTKIPQETQISLEDLKIGDYIEVIAKQDISQKQEFEVSQIRILPR